MYKIVPMVFILCAVAMVSAQYFYGEKPEKEVVAKNNPELIEKVSHNDS